MTRAAEVAQLLRVHPWPDDLTVRSIQRGIATVLDAHRMGYRREVSLGGKGRASFLTEWGVAISVRDDGDATAVKAQLQLWATDPAVGVLLLATSRGAHTALPLQVGGKPLHVVHLRPAR